jgi:Alpha/beta hydrolase family
VSGQAKPTIVFAHGLWADGSCYSRVVARLLADGFQVISTQNHLNTVADDAAAVRTSFARADGPVVLVGHSYGALSSRQPAPTSAWRHSSTYARSPRRRGTQRLSIRTNIPRRPSSNTSKLWMGGFGCARQASQNSQETCRRRSSNSSGPLRWHLWPISLINPSWARRGSINQRLTLLVLMTGPFNLNCSASWLRV